jgi:predicted metalloendopeptidase
LGEEQASHSGDEVQVDNYQSTRPEHGDNMESTNAGTTAGAPPCVNHRPSGYNCSGIVITGIFASAVMLTAAAPPAARNAGEMDRSIKPGDDFYRYANGGWLETVAIRAGQASYDTRAMLMEKTSQRVQDLVQEAAASHPVKGSVAQKVGDYYASFLDEDRIEAKGLALLGDQLAQISAITNKASLSAYLGTTLTGEVDGLTANADHIFGLWVNQGFEDASRNVVHLWQGGLGMPDRDNYIDSSPKMVALRAKYQTHIATVLKLAGITDAESKSARVLSLEVRIAEAFAPDADATDVLKQNNLWKRGDFGVKASGMNWEAYFTSAGVADQPVFTVWQPSAVIGVSALVGTESTDVWKDYLRFHLVEHYAGVLPKAIADEHAAFCSNLLAGTQPTPDRKSLAIAGTNGALGQAVGQLYAQRYFPPESKVRAKAMATDLISAFRSRISSLSWMSPETRKKALAKLAALEIGIGYPDRWIDYSTLDIVRGDAFGNMRRAEAFLRLRNLTKLRQPVDPIEWPINPQIPGAVIMFSPNAEFFSAAILQPPYFDGQGDAASNYGSAGAGMAHEISHSFDELGNIYDAHGRLGDWWTAEDRTRYHEVAEKLVTQFNNYCPLADLCVNGKQILTENVADLAGLLVAHDAYILSLKGQPDILIGGLSGEQRFFLAFAQRWRKVQNEAALRKQITADTHSPGEYRSDTVRNVDAWYTAYEIAPGDKLFLGSEDRVRIW